MKDKNKKEEKSLMNSIIEWVKVFLFAIIIAAVITMFIKPTLVRGDSMLPTLHENDYLIINRIGYKIGEPEKGDIIVFKSHIVQSNGTEKDLVKRIIGVAGDEILITEGQVFVNGELLDESYLEGGTYTEGEINLVVPEGKLFVLGDNRLVSLDSRSEEVGLVDVDSIQGKVFLRLYPFSDIGFI